ncbi:11548_t:CDS:2, partial [Diversispora eburnea]
MYYVRKALKSEKEQFGIIEVQVAENILHLNILVKDNTNIYRYYHIQSAEIPIQVSDTNIKYCKESSSIPLTNSIQKHHLSSIFGQHYEQLCGIFCGKPVSIIIDETIDKKVCSVINTLLSYQDSAAYMKKSVREILQSIMPQIRHNTCCAHIIQLISQAWTNIYYFDEIRKLILNIKKTMVHSKAWRSRYMDYLWQHGIKDISTNFDNSLNSQNTQQLTLRFMPLPNTTRWNS